MQFDPDVVAEIVELAGGRPYYLQKLGYFAVVEAAGPGDDVALKVDDHVREHDLIVRET